MDEFLEYAAEQLWEHFAAEYAWLEFLAALHGQPLEESPMQFAAMHLNWVIVGQMP